MGRESGPRGETTLRTDTSEIGRCGWVMDRMNQRTETDEMDARRSTRQPTRGAGGKQYESREMRQRGAMDMRTTQVGAR